jgi:hypothetical protein
MLILFYISGSDFEHGFTNGTKHIGFSPFHLLKHFGVSDDSGFSIVCLLPSLFSFVSQWHCSIILKKLFVMFF